MSKTPRQVLTKRRRAGLSLAEIVIALGLFSVGVAGLVLTAQSVFEGLRNASRGDIEAVYANMLVARINPYDPAVEINYDETTKTALDMPNGSEPCDPNDPNNPCLKAFFTSIVDSADATPDIKDIHIYLYRAANSTVPYRQFKREIAPSFVGFDLGVDSGYFKDSLGHVWAPLANGQNYSSTDGSRRSGLTQTVTNFSSVCALTGNSAAFNTYQEPSGGSTKLGYTFLATPGRVYTLRLGGVEPEPSVTAGQRKMKIMVNGTQVGTLDPVVDAGGSCKAVLKTFTVKPSGPDVNGVSSIAIELQPDTGAILPPRLAEIALERTEL